MDFSIYGIVVRGKGYGRKLGFPTVNLDADAKDIPVGVYAGKGIINRKIYRAAIIISEGKSEAHLLGYRGDAYGKEVTLKLKKFLREYKNFNSEKELIDQIVKDIKKC
ncbi:MAG: riboflavin kinase [Candidatus Paceibacterota bacterium]